MGIITKIYKATVTVQVVTIFYMLMSGEQHDITKEPFEKLGQYRDWVLGVKPIEAPVYTHSHH